MASRLIARRRSTTLLPCQSPARRKGSGFPSSQTLGYNQSQFSMYSFSMVLFNAEELTPVCIYLQVSMATGEDYICQANERSVSLTYFRVGVLPPDLLLYDYPPDQKSRPYRPRLCPEAQRLFLLLLRMADALIWLDKLPTHISAADIVLTYPYMMPKLAPSVLLIDGLSDTHIRTFMFDLRGIFIHLIRHSVTNLPIPPEVHALFDLMSQPTIPYNEPNQTKKDLPLMLVHSSLMPMENRGDAFLRMYQFSEEILKWLDSRAYHFVMNEIVHGSNLELLAAENDNMNCIFQRGTFPRGTNAKAIHHCKYNRHGPCHALEVAFDPTRPHGLRYTSKHINHGNYVMSELLLSTMQAALHIAGHLQVLQLQSLMGHH